MVPLSWYLGLGFVLFAIGIVGVLTRRHIIMVLLSIELMLNAVNITFVAYAHALQQVSGQVIVFFILTMAAAEVALGLAMIIALYRIRPALHVDEISLLSG